MFRNASRLVLGGVAVCTAAYFLSPNLFEKKTATAAANAVPNHNLTSGHRIPALAYGSGTVWYRGADNNQDHRKASPELVNLTKEALKRGIRHLDCAEDYGNELEVGIAIKEYLAENKDVKREDLFVSTKLHTSLDDVEGAVKESLKRLNLKYLDMYLIHSPFKIKDLPKKWEEMEKLVSKGYVRSIGVSNFRVEDLEKILKSCKIKPVVNQIEYHPYLQQSSLIKYCKDHNILIEAYASLTPLTNKTDGPVNVDLLRDLSNKYGQPVSSVLLAWARQEAADVVVTTTRKPERITEAQNSFTIYLEEDERRKIREAGKKVTFRKYWKDDFPKHEKQE